MHGSINLQGQQHNCMQAQKAISTGKSCLTLTKDVLAYRDGDTSELSRRLGNDAGLLPLFHRALGIALGAARDCDFADLPSTPSGTVFCQLASTIV